jgi:hypothetical protein
MVRFISSANSEPARGAEERQARHVSARYKPDESKREQENKKNETKQKKKSPGKLRRRNVLMPVGRPPRAAEAMKARDAAICLSASRRFQPAMEELLGFGDWGFRSEGGGF